MALRQVPIKVEYKGFIVWSDGVIIGKRGKVLKQSVGNSGYLEAGLGILNNKVHRLVYEAFNGPVPDGMLVHHKDGNKCNPHILNLEASTYSKNGKASYKAGRKPSGGVPPKLRPEEIWLIKRLVSGGISGRLVAKMFRVSHTTVQRKCNG